MNINRHNYEEFFMLYADNELSAADRKAVELFVAANPDLKAELDMLGQFKLTADESVIFDNKALLLKPETAGAFINGENYESFFVLYADGELTAAQQRLVEEFVYNHPQYQADFELLQQVKYTPDNSVVFENKESLYRYEGADRKVVVIRWWRYAAAALLLLVAGLFWIMQQQNSSQSAGSGKEVATTKTTQSTIDSNKQTITDNSVTQQPTVIASTEKTITDKAKETTDRKENKNTALTASNEYATNKKTTRTEQAIKEVVVTNEKDLNASVTVNTVANNAAINTGNNGLIATNKNIVIDQPDTYLNPDANDNNISYASFAEDEKVEVLNTTVNKKTPLRGFFRKAARLVAHRTNRDGDGSNKKGILIGSFEIAMK